MLSFIVPAHDEAASIVAVVEAIRAAAARTPEPHEIVVVDDASTDATAALAAGAGARVVGVACRHIAAARNAGARAARGDVFVFVDADTLIGADVVAGLRAAIAAGGVGGGAAIRFDEPIPPWVRWMLPASMWLARRFRLAGGCFLFCTRRAFEAVGGYDERLYAAEEIAFCRALGRQGEVVILRASVLTSGRKLRTHSMRELMASGARVVQAGRAGTGDRSRLDVWYGPRRPDDTRRRD